MKRRLTAYKRSESLGPELITNGDFATGNLTGWTSFGSVSVVGNKAVLDGTSGTSGIFQGVLSNNTSYQASVELSNSNGDYTSVEVYGGGVLITTFGSEGIKNFTFITGTLANANYQLRCSNGAVISWDNISLKEIL